MGPTHWPLELAQHAKVENKSQGVSVPKQEGTRGPSRNKGVLGPHTTDPPPLQGKHPDYGQLDNDPKDVHVLIPRLRICDPVWPKGLAGVIKDLGLGRLSGIIGGSNVVTRVPKEGDRGVRVRKKRHDHRARGWRRRLGREPRGSGACRHRQRPGNRFSPAAPRRHTALQTPWL